MKTDKYSTKPRLKKWTFNLTVTGLLIITLLTGIVLNPNLTYANKTAYYNFTIFHDKPVDKALWAELDSAAEILKSSELYDSKLQLDICLNDGSKYPALIQILSGEFYAKGFYHEIVLEGNANYEGNYIEIRGYRWNFVQLLAHEATHCFQFDYFGFWKSNPVANIPKWKWEGYPEYVARQNPDQKDLAKNITRLIETEKTDNNGWILFADSTGAVIPYYNYWLLMEYCMDIKKMTYRQILIDTTREEKVRMDMMNWYKRL